VYRSHISCGQKSHDDDTHEHSAGDAIEESGNQALYDEVTKVHDEVMPKMDDIYKMKEEPRIGSPTHRKWRRKRR
jgi:hypothetical protein